jgi:hypothetical protein
VRAIVEDPVFISYLGLDDDPWGILDALRHNPQASVEHRDRNWPWYRAEQWTDGISYEYLTSRPRHASRQVRGALMARPWSSQSVGVVFISHFRRGVRGDSAVLAQREQDLEVRKWLEESGGVESEHLQWTSLVDTHWIESWNLVLSNEEFKRDFLHVKRPSPRFACKLQPPSGRLNLYLVMIPSTVTVK